MSPTDGPPRPPRAPVPVAGEIDALVLAAGRGVRLGALTASTPKVLLPVDGRPLLDYHLDALRSVGIRRVVLIVHYLAEQIDRHVDGGRAFGLDVTSVHQSEALGTGDAVRVASPYIRSDPFLVCYADTFLPAEGALLASFLSDATPKIAGAQVADGGSYGRLATAGAGDELRLVGLEEKDGRPVPALVNAGLYLLPRSMLELVAGLPRSVRGEYELTDAIRLFVARGGTVRVVPVADWVDAGTEESLARANQLARGAHS
jgi:UDP-N-acetylglucosamine diphosphorylase / glucose-1-phosphate thymidylyltransferase / UDP-N-acetylgalactosamine diphosphorylase / glucosamine-1-phosphate N-acetyltransferase / galactosamine-1-phosphate N-acetyltransferase